jgi:hypothetical protein
MIWRRQAVFHGLSGFYFVEMGIKDDVVGLFYVWLFLRIVIFFVKVESYYTTAQDFGWLSLFFG